MGSQSRSPLSSSICDDCTAVAGALGKVWKQSRKKLPPSAKSIFAELLLDLRLHILPAEHLDAVSNIGRARYDIRGIAELLQHLAIVSAAKPNFPPPPPPPPVQSVLCSAIHCSELELFRAKLYSPGGIRDVSAQPATNRSNGLSDKQGSSTAIGNIGDTIPTVSSEHQCCMPVGNITLTIGSETEHQHRKSPTGNVKSILLPNLASTTDDLANDNTSNQSGVAVRARRTPIYDSDAILVPPLPASN